MVDPVPSPESPSPRDARSEVPAPPRSAAVPHLLGWRDRLDDLRARGMGGTILAWAVAAVAVGGVGFWLLRPTPAPLEESIPPATSTAGGSTSGPGGTSGAATPGEASSTTTMPTEIVAHAAGAVARPGVYRLEVTARVDDLVRRAGGLAPDADASRLNLAAPLSDGARVYVPRSGEEVPDLVGPDGSPSVTGSGPPRADDGPEEPIDLNTADEALLDELPGVGPATAAAIIAWREGNGGFRAVEDLLEVRGIGEAKLEQLRPLVTVG